MASSADHYLATMPDSQSNATRASSSGSSSAAFDQSAKKDTPRARKRSIFGKARRDTNIAPPLPPPPPPPTIPHLMTADYTQHIQQGRASEDDRSPALTPTSTIDSRTFEPSKLPQGPTPQNAQPPQFHRRTPSASLFGRRSNASGSTTGTITSERNSTSREANASAQSLGRKSIISSSPAPASPSAWFQRNAAKAANSLSSSSSSKTLLGRDRAASVGNDTTISSSSPSRWAFASANSPSGMRRTFSKRSVFSVQQEPEATIDTSGAGVTSAETPRRKMFGRSHRTSLDPSSHSITSDARRTSIEENGSLQAINGPTSSNSGGGGGFLRKVSSRGLLRSSRNGKDREGNPMASTDSLASTTTSSTSRGTFQRMRPDRFMRVARTESAEAGMINDFEHVAQTSDVAYGRQVQQQLLQQQDAHQGQAVDLHSQDADLRASTASRNAEGIPKRLSGWLLNMMQNETEATALPTDSEGNANVKPDNLSVSASSLSPKPRSTGIFSALTATTRGRSDAPISQPAPASTARGGLDRALRYFLDSSTDRNSDAEAGIWLLGVYHAPFRGKVSVDADSLEAASGPYGAANHSDRVEQGQDETSSFASTTPHRTRETSPSITSGSSFTSNGGVLVDDWTKKLSNEIGDNETFDARLPHKASISETSRRPSKSSSKSPATLEAVLSTEHDFVPADKTVNFQADFGSRIWCTYRSHFTPIARDGSISEMYEKNAAMAVGRPTSPRKAIPPSSAAAVDDATDRDPSKCDSYDVTRVQKINVNAQTDAPGPSGGLSDAFGIVSAKPQPAYIHHVTSTSSAGLSEKMGLPNLWNRATAAAQAYGFAGRSGLTTDAGWGCMLRTGQSVLANALLNVHLGRQWCRCGKPLPLSLAPKKSEAPDSHSLWRQQREQYATYTRLLSWFMDEPDAQCPFGVHRMAREGKRLGKEVGEWFGPSTAAGAIKKLVDDFPECGLGVSVASDSSVYLDLVKQQAQKGTSAEGSSNKRWERPVLILIGVRLGLDGVHPMYHDSIKACFSFPQSVGIAGGRPSSSYYFLGYQGNSLFYLDPHQVRPSVTYKQPPSHLDDLQEWWAQAYSDAELATYHNERPRRMPMKSLDPSMLLGFLINDEASLQDFVARVKALPRPIFSVMDSMPKWMVEGSQGDFDNPEDKAIESISESSADDMDGADDSSRRSEAADDLDEAKLRLPTGKEASHARRTRDKGLLMADSLAHSVTSASTMTPRSEQNFELVSSQTTANALSATTSGKSASPAIAFPSLGSYDEVSPSSDSAAPEQLYGSDFAPSTALAGRQNDAPHMQPLASGSSDMESAWEEIQRSEGVTPSAID